MKNSEQKKRTRKRSPDCIRPMLTLNPEMTARLDAVVKHYGIQGRSNGQNGRNQAIYNLITEKYHALQEKLEFQKSWEKYCVDENGKESSPRMKTPDV